MARRHELELGLMRTDRGLFVDKGNVFVNVRHPDFNFGAKGDGVTDDGIAWNLALAHLPTEGGCLVVPPGDYLLTTAFSFGAQDNVLLWLMPGVVLTGEALPAEANNNEILDWRAGNVGSSIGTDPTGTADRITVTAGVVDIAATYVGQTSITTLGTIATGAVPASLVTTGTFGTGDYTFPGALTVTTSLLVTTSATITTDLAVLGTKASLNGPATAQAGFHSAGAIGSGEAAGYWYEITDATANEGIWRIAAESSQLIGRLYADTYAFGSSVTWLAVNRTGTTCDQVQFLATDMLFTVGGSVKSTGHFDGTAAASEYRLVGKGVVSSDGAGTTLLIGASSGTNWLGINVSETGITTTILGPLATAETVQFATPTTSLASFRVPHGTAPSTPTNGDVWTTTAGLFIEINGATVGPLAASGAAAAGTLTGTTLAANVVSSSLTSLGTIASLVATTADINGGTIDGTNIGATTGGTLAATSLTITNAGIAAMLIQKTHASDTNGLDIDFSAVSTDNNTNYFLKAFDSTTNRLLIYSDGDVVNHDGTYGTISDIRHKSNVTPATSQWEDVKRLSQLAINYEMNVDIANGRPRRLLGWSAQALEADGMDGLVMHTFDHGTGEETLAVKTSVAHTKGIIALGEALLRIEALEARVGPPVV
jgi:hypothetical protein